MKFPEGSSVSSKDEYLFVYFSHSIGDQSVRRCPRERLKDQSSSVSIHSI